MEVRSPEEVKEAEEVLRKHLGEGWRSWRCFGALEQLNTREDPDNNAIGKPGILWVWDRLSRFPEMPWPADEAMEAVWTLRNGGPAGLFAVLSEAKSVYEISSLLNPVFLRGGSHEAFEDDIYEFLSSGLGSEDYRLASWSLYSMLSCLRDQYLGRWQDEKHSVNGARVEKIVDALASEIANKPEAVRKRLWWEILCFLPRLSHDGLQNRTLLVNLLVDRASKVLSGLTSEGILPEKAEWLAYQNRNRSIGAVLPWAANLLPKETGGEILEQFFSDMVLRSEGPQENRPAPSRSVLDHWYREAAGLAVACNGGEWWAERLQNVRSGFSPWHKEDYERRRDEIVWLLLVGCVACRFMHRLEREWTGLGNQILEVGTEILELLGRTRGISDGNFEPLLVQLAHVVTLMPQSERATLMSLALEQVDNAEVIRRILTDAELSLTQEEKGGLAGELERREKFERLLNDADSD